MAGGLERATLHLRRSTAIWLALSLLAVSVHAREVDRAPRSAGGKPPTVSKARQRVDYQLSFPEPRQHWMQVDATFSALDSRPLQLAMSRSSPGRYALHQFGKNVFDVEAYDSRGRPIAVHQKSPGQWLVPHHDGAVRLRYKVYGDRVDGTYLGIDENHAHINAPAAFIFARGLERRAVKVTLDHPADKRWRASTQLLETSDPSSFRAPNHQYLMDSPIELSDHQVYSFTAGKQGRRRARIDVALHHDGKPEQAKQFVDAIEKIVHEAEAVFGELPEFEGGAYHFLADYHPTASWDAMEHRNSTALSGPSPLSDDTARSHYEEVAAHEFFHAWNAERIRPRSLEPFDFERENPSEELWLAEGFTHYYGKLIHKRAGLSDERTFAGKMAGLINSVLASPGNRYRSLTEMSAMAPATDAATAIDKTNLSNTFISYYPWGGAVALALDLELRGRSDGQLTLDHYMQSLWRAHGKPGDRGEPGLVLTPYDNRDAEHQLAKLTQDAAFARDFFARYIEGGELPDFEPLLERAGLLVRRRQNAWTGGTRLSKTRGGMKVASPPALDSALYRAGLVEGDVITSLAGKLLRNDRELRARMRAIEPGRPVDIVYRHRGREQRAAVTFDADPRIDVVPAEHAGQQLDEAQQSFRQSWLGAHQPD